MPRVINSESFWAKTTPPPDHYQQDDRRRGRTERLMEHRGKNNSFAQSHRHPAQERHQAVKYQQRPSTADDGLYLGTAGFDQARRRHHQRRRDQANDDAGTRRHSSTAAQDDVLLERGNHVTRRHAWSGQKQQQPYARTIGVPGNHKRRPDRQGRHHAAGFGHGEEERGAGRKTAGVPQMPAGRLDGRRSSRKLRESKQQQQQRQAPPVSDRKIYDEIFDDLEFDVIVDVGDDKHRRESPSLAAVKKADGPRERRRSSVGRESKQRRSFNPTPSESPLNDVTSVAEDPRYGADDFGESPVMAAGGTDRESQTLKRRRRRKSAPPPQSSTHSAKLIPPLGAESATSTNRPRVRSDESELESTMTTEQRRRSYQAWERNKRRASDHQNHRKSQQMDQHRQSHQMDQHRQNHQMENHRKSRRNSHLEHRNSRESYHKDRHLEDNHSRENYYDDEYPRHHTSRESYHKNYYLKTHSSRQNYPDNHYLKDYKSRESHHKDRHPRGHSSREYYRNDHQRYRTNGYSSSSSTSLPPRTMHRLSRDLDFGAIHQREEQHQTPANNLVLKLSELSRRLNRMSDKFDSQHHNHHRRVSKAPSQPRRRSSARRPSSSKELTYPHLEDMLYDDRIDLSMENPLPPKSAYSSVRTMDRLKELNSKFVAISNSTAKARKLSDMRRALEKSGEHTADPSSPSPTSTPLPDFALFFAPPTSLERKNVTTTDGSHAVKPLETNRRLSTYQPNTSRDLTYYVNMLGKDQGPAPAKTDPTWSAGGARLGTFSYPDWSCVKTTGTERIPNPK